MLKKCIPPTLCLRNSVDANIPRNTVLPDADVSTAHPSDVQDEKLTTSFPVNDTEDGRLSRNFSVKNIEDGRLTRSFSVTDNQEGRHSGYNDSAPTLNHDQQNNLAFHISLFSNGKLKVMSHAPPINISNTEIEIRNSELDANPSKTEEMITTHPESHISRKELDEWWRTEFPSDSSPETSPNTTPQRPTNVNHTTPIDIPLSCLMVNTNQINPPGPENHIQLPLINPTNLLIILT